MSLHLRTICLTGDCRGTGSRVTENKTGFEINQRSGELNEGTKEYRYQLRAKKQSLKGQFIKDGCWEEV